MRSNLLLDEIRLVQFEYKELLTVLLPKLKSCHAPEALDEIDLFWFRHFEEIQLYLREWFPGENSYVFTAATYLDYDNKEHLPFLLMGEKHILDDPLCRYVKLRSKMPKGKKADFLYKQIGVTAEDNLKILENVNEEIFILPTRLFNQPKTDISLYKVGERAFVSLFNDIDSFNDYFSKCDSIDDIIQYARKDIGNLVLFSEDDNASLPFEERFKTALLGTQYMIDLNKSDSHNFYILVFGCIQQAIDIIVSCVEYGCIPYIRYPVSLHYVSLLAKSMLDKERIDSLLFKMGVAFFVYRLCDKERLASVCINRFMKKNQKYNFNSRLFPRMDEHGINEKNFYNHSITQLVIDELNKFYDVLSEADCID